MSGTVNLTKHFAKQGVNRNTSHEALVVNNDDVEQLGRIQVRIAQLHNGIEDKHLPWAIPKFSHADGAKGGDAFDRSGTFYVPRKNTKVLVEFQDGNPHYPVWSGYSVDETTKLKEVKKNYPDRACIRFANGTFVLIDSKTNEVFFHNAGDTHFIIQGDVTHEIHGDSQETCHASKDKAIDAYFTGAEELPVKDAKQHQQKKINFQGLGKKGSGNKHITVGGDYTMKIEGDRIVEINGDDTLKVKGKRTVTIEGNDDLSINGSMTTNVKGSGTIKASGTLTLKGSMIFLN